MHIDGIIERVPAEHEGLTRKEVTELVVQVVLFKGAAAIWTEPEREAGRLAGVEFDLDTVLRFSDL